MGIEFTMYGTDYRNPEIYEKKLSEEILAYKRLKKFIPNITFEESVKKRTEAHSITERKKMTERLRKQIIERDKYTCQRCGKYMPDKIGLNIDHIIPLSKRGTTTYDNLQVLCENCNRFKGNYSDEPDYYARMIKEYEDESQKE